MCDVGCFAICDLWLRSLISTWHRGEKSTCQRFGETDRHLAGETQHVTELVTPGRMTSSIAAAAVIAIGTYYVILFNSIQHPTLSLSDIRPHHTATNLGGAASSYLSSVPGTSRNLIATLTNLDYLSRPLLTYRQPAVSMRVSSILVAVAAATVANISSAQDYQDYADGYEQDNLYQDYAARQQGKEVGGG